MSMDFLSAIKNRRTIYGISKECPVSDNRLIEIIQQSVLHAPSAFNSQSSRVLVLLGEHHNRLWDLTKEALRKIVPADSFPGTEERINSFRNGYGTVLFFEDQNVIEYLQNNYTLYKDHFPAWSQHASGMLQYIIWAFLETEGLGVSLQHYNPLIDEQVKTTWDIPDSWKLIAEMPFGKPTAPPGDKEFKPLDERVKIYK